METQQNTNRKEDRLVPHLLQRARQVNDRHVSGRHTERHAGELAVQVRDHLRASTEQLSFRQISESGFAYGKVCTHLSDRLGSAGGRRDDVEARATATTPVLR